MFHPLLLEALFTPTHTQCHRRPRRGYVNQRKHQSLGTYRSAYLSEEDTAYHLTIETAHLLGRSLDSLKLETVGSVMTLTIPSVELLKAEGMTQLINEIPLGEYIERYQLPHDIDLDQVTATLKGTHLLISLPKQHAERRRINIETSTQNHDDGSITQ